MALRITEYSGLSFNNGLPSLPPLAVQSVSVGSSASTATGLGANTGVVTLDSDAGCYVLVGSSGSTVVVTSTNGVRIPANVQPIPYAVAPRSRITVLST